MKAWITRGKDGRLFLLPEKPVKKGFYNWLTKTWWMVLEDSEEFKNVKWEDEKPTEVEITIKIKIGG